MNYISRKNGLDIFISPISATRYWRIIIDNGSFYLRSLVYKNIWPYRKVMESDILKSDLPFSGIYSIKKGVTDTVIKSGSLVKGNVYIWGYIQEHINGYRSEFAYPSSIDSFYCIYCKQEKDIKEISIVLGGISYPSNVLSFVCSNKDCIDMKDFTKNSLYIKYSAYEEFNINDVYKNILDEYAIN